jgi:tetratricopeptide (TPR) repeat protein
MVLGINRIVRAHAEAGAGAPDLEAAVSAAVRRGARAEAINLAAQALKRGSRHPLVLVLAAEGLELRGQLDEAAGLLRLSIEGAPRQKIAWMRLASLLAGRQRFSEAARAFEAVLGIEPGSYAALMGAAEMRLFMNELEAAERLYQRAAEAAPQAAEPLAILAVTAAQRGDAGAARALAARAARLAPDSLGAALALARAELLEAAPALAEARAARLLARQALTEENRVDILDIRAAARDAQDRPDEAFADYAALNGILQRLHAAFGADPDRRPPVLARRQAEFLTAAPPGAWALKGGENTTGGATVRGHVFLLGFPRSGTTLLETALAGHPACVTLEEVNILALAGEDLRDGEAAWSRLAALPPEEAEARRRIYWKAAGETLGGDLSGKVVIDKLPLHTLHLPLIAKLFPEARILFALRDPRDVVLSCFRRRFRVNAAMYEFLSLGGAADFYDAVMTLAAAARDVLPLNLLEVRHESVIADFDGVMGGVLDFIGLDWDPRVRGFAERLGGRMKTPSHAQLRRGLSRDGVGQWRRYARHMAPVLPILEPWAARFGYPPADMAEETGRQQAGISPTGNDIAMATRPAAL